MALDQFTPATRAWFQAAFDEPTPAQTLGWPAIAAGEHTLIHAPTGSGKTLAAFLWALDRLIIEPTPDRDERCRVLYVSPLKALAHDVEGSHGFVLCMEDRRIGYATDLGRVPVGLIERLCDIYDGSVARLRSALAHYLRTGEPPSVRTTTC